MIEKIFIKQRGAQLAILLALCIATSNGAAECYAQVAGFASSRVERAGAAESGSRRILPNITQFRTSETPEIGSQTPQITQPVATSTATSASVRDSRPRTTTTTTTTSRTDVTSVPTRTAATPRSSSSVRANTSASTRSSMNLTTSNATIKRGVTGGVASHLLDELEEEMGEGQTDASEPSLKMAQATRSPVKTARRSLREEPFPSSLELLDDDSSDLADDLDADADDSTVLVADRRAARSNARPGVISTEDDDDVASLLDSDESDLDESELEEEPAATPVKRASTKTETKSQRAKTPKPRASTKPAEPQVQEAVEPQVEEDSEVENVEVEPVEEQEAPVEISQLDENFQAIEARADDFFGASATTVTNASTRQTNDVPQTVRGATPLSAGRMPNIEVFTIGAKKLIVGQESVYKIVARNTGAEAARKFQIVTELPESVVNVQARASEGVATIQKAPERGVENACLWRVDALNPNQELTLEIRLTPTKRVAFELVSRFEYERASARADIEVQEPILEALIEGRDSIEWGVEDKYRLRIRNIGNGDAEDVNLAVSTGENNANQKIGTLRAGEEKTVEMAVKTASDDFFTIDVDVQGAYGLQTHASKRITTLRGKLEIEVETPDLQFVEGEFETVIHVRNIGNATLQNVDVVAQAPVGVDVAYCSNQARQNLQKRRVYWLAPFIRPDEETTFSMRCRAADVGSAKIEVVGVDRTGVVAQAASTINVESIAVLTMRVNAPKEPVAVGKKCFYELVIENTGTREARQINSGVFLGSGMKPIAVEGNLGYVYAEDSKVLFKRIDTLEAGDSVVFRIEAEALAPGNQKIQAMLQSAPEDVSLLSEETTYCYERARVNSTRPGAEFDNQTLTAERTEGRTVRK
ncbi:MAG: hypothetical protein Q4G03_04105 [Planctomycetia bacterium]|nr:hypothetical protein [Planctomycetia bacterium]